jgi:hypothetical protein
MGRTDLWLVKPATGPLLQDLADAVMTKRRTPEDAYEVAAMLESMGITDRTASEVYGADNVFALANSLWPMIMAQAVVETFHPTERVKLGAYLNRLFRSFLRGILFALPMAVSVAAMLTIDLSLWSYRYLSLEEATAIAIGTILSFMAVGGFTQAIARRGFLYIGQGNYYTARKVAFEFVRVGLVVSLVAALAYLLFNLVFTLFPWRMTAITLVYFLFLSAIWLSVTIIYMLQKELTFTALITGGIVMVWFLFRRVGLNIILAQLISLLAVSLIGVFLALSYFKRAESRMESGERPPLPRLSVLAYTSIPFLLYGFLYFTFLFADRVVAWSANSTYMPYLIWFRGEYELGLDFALLCLILPMGLIEVVVNELMLGLEAAQKNRRAAEAGALNREYQRLYGTRAIMVIAFALLNAAAIYCLVRWLCRFDPLWWAEFNHPVTQFVMVWASLAYALITVGLMNSLLMFCVARPEQPIRAVGAALLVDMLLGFVLSRWVSYYWAVIGLTAGALVFAVVSTGYVWKMLSKLDYHLYVASS